LPLLKVPLLRDGRIGESRHRPNIGHGCDQDIMPLVVKLSERRLISVMLPSGFANEATRPAR
jgi:hypothetical protein